MSREAVIVSSARTGLAKSGRGGFNMTHGAAMGGHAIKHAIERAGIDAAEVEDVIMGCVGQAGEQAANIGRNAVLSSRLPESVPATSVDRQCGSSQQSIHFAAQAVMSGTMDCVIAAGVESMTRVPMGTPIVLPFKNDLGFYVSEEMQKRYPNVQFSQFAGAEMVASKYGLNKASSLDMTSNNPSHARTRAQLCRSSKMLEMFSVVTSGSLTIPLEVTYDPSNERQSAY